MKLPRELYSIGRCGEQRIVPLWIYCVKTVTLSHTIIESRSIEEEQKILLTRHHLWFSPRYRGKATILCRNIQLFRQNFECPACSSFLCILHIVYLVKQYSSLFTTQWSDPATGVRTRRKFFARACNVYLELTMGHWYELYNLESVFSLAFSMSQC